MHKKSETYEDLINDVDLQPLYSKLYTDPYSKGSKAYIDTQMLNKNCCMLVNHQLIYVKV